MTSGIPVKYHTIDGILSYNKLLSFDVGGRSIGKSFAWKKYVVDRWLKKKRKFIYLRRQKDDIDMLVSQNGFWGDICIKYPDSELSMKGGAIPEIIMDGESIGYCLYLNKIKSVKSIPMGEVDWIIFDEFIPEDGRYKGGKDGIYTEPRAIESLLVSVARGGGKVVRDDVHIALIGNLHDRYNPFFVYFGISEKFKDNTQWIRGDFWVVCKDGASEVRAEIEKSQIGQMLKKTAYGSMAMNGEWEHENNTFIEKRKPAGKYFCTLISDGKKYGVYEEIENDCYFIHPSYDDDNLYIYALNTSSHNGNTVLTMKNTRAWKIQTLQHVWGIGKLRFYSYECKSLWIRFMGLETK